MTDVGEATPVYPLMIGCHKTLRELVPECNRVSKKKKKIEL